MLMVGSVGEGSHRYWIKVEKGDWCPPAVSGVLAFSG